MADVPSNSTFLAAYPEFMGADAALVTAKLTEAAARTNENVYQSAALAQYAVMLSAAILLTRSPYGRQMRTENPDQYIVWEYELRKAQRAATIGLRVF